MVNPSFLGVTSVLISQTLFSKLSEEEKAKFAKYKDVYKKDYLGFDDEDAKYFEDLAKDLDGKHFSLELLGLEEYGTLF